MKLMYLLVAASAFSIAAVAGSKSNTEDRNVLILAAINEVNEDFAMKEEAAKSHIPTSAERKLQSFKMATEESLAQGKARLRFERMVKHAELKILEKQQRNVAIQTAEEKVESLAMQVLHKPGSVLSSEEIARMYQESDCKATLTVAPSNCTSTKYRTASGVCNNLQNPIFGAANTRMRRLIPPRYDDGISRLQGTLQIRGVSIVPGPFSPPSPSPRVVSLGVVVDRPINDSQFSHILMQWGQFMDHDLDAIPEFKLNSCPSAGCTVVEDSCVPYPVPQDDMEVQVTRAKGDVNACHGFRRSLPACDVSTPSTLSPREQVNSISHFIDGSMIYHHNLTIQNTLIRDGSSPDGLLRVGPPAKGTSQPSLPLIYSTNGPVICFIPPCFVAGDLRVNEHTALTVMHTIWVREHNRIARTLRTNNPQLSSNDIFETTRNIVIAQIQKITYRNYLPLLLGDNFPTLIPKYQAYNPSIFPNIPNSFATAAYRFGHSQIQPFFERLDSNYQSIPAGPLFLVNAFFNISQFLDNGGTDPMLRGLLSKPAREVDEFLNTVLTNHLFASSSNSPGLDLASINIQRGRDHGLPTYLNWKEWAKTQCNLESDFRNQLTQIRLLQTYGSLNNVDLFVGGLAEAPVKGGVVGAVFACIFANTFIALRDGDRFYYENPNTNSTPFTAAQRAEIEKASLSRVICDNSDVKEIQRNAFMANQRRIPCSNIPSINLSIWNQSPSPLPRFCFIKVQNAHTSRTRITAVSRLVGDRRNCVSGSNLSGGRNGCLAFVCPRPGRNTQLTVTNNRRCSVRSSLQSNSNFTDQFSRTLTTIDFSTTDDGLYTNYRSCYNGKRLGLLFCDDRKGSAMLASASNIGEQNDEQDTGSDDKGVTFLSDDELRQSLSDDISPDHLREILGNDDIDERNKVIAIMEEVLTKLKNLEQAGTSREKAKEKERKEKSEGKKTVNSKILEELEGALQDIE